MKSGHVATGVATQIEPDFPRRRSDSVLAWRLGAEVRDQLLHPGLAALGALWRPFLQAVVFADRYAYLKVLAARLALELVDRHDFPPPTSAHHRQRSRHRGPTAREGFRPINATPPV